MFRSNMQKQEHNQQGSSRAFAPYQNANQRQRSHNDSIDIELSMQNMSIQNTRRSRGGRPTARRGKSFVRGGGRVVGRGRAMSTHSPVDELEQGLNESLFGSQHVSHRNRAQGIFTRQQEDSSLSKPNQGSSQKVARPSLIERSHKSPSTLKPAQTSSVLGGAQQQQQQQAVFGKPSSGGKVSHPSTLLGAAQHQPPFGGNVRAEQQPIVEPEYTTKRSFNETDAENIAPTDTIKKQHTEIQQHPKEAVFGKRNLNPQAAPFRPANAIGKQSLNPQVAAFQPAKSVGEQGLNPQATPFKPSMQSGNAHIDEIQKTPKPVASDSVYRDEPVESTPQPNQQGTNGNRPETPKALEAAADPIIEQQRFETLMKRTAELNEFARQRALQDKEEQNRRQRALQEKLRLEEEQKIMALLEKKEQEKARQLKSVAWWRRQQMLCFEEEQTVMALLDKEVQEKARRLKAEAWQRRREKLLLEEEQKIRARKEKQEQEKARRLEAEAWWRRQEKLCLEQEQATIAFLEKQEQEKTRRQEAEARWRRQQKLCFEEEQTAMALLEKQEQEKARRLKAEAWQRRREKLRLEEEQKKARRLEAEAWWRRQEKLCLEQEQATIAFLEKQEQEKTRRQEAEARWRRQQKLCFEEEQTAMALLEKQEQENACRLKAEAWWRRQEKLRKRKSSEEFIKEIATTYKMKRNKMLKFIQEKTKPWLSRSRHNIKKRNASITKRGDILRFSVKLHNSNPYSGFKIDDLYKRHKLRTPEIMEDRTNIALQSEDIAEEFNVYKNENELLSYVWKKENFNGLAYREVAKKLYQSQIEGEHAWAHLISCDPTATNSINWFSHKFDLDGESQTKISRYEEIDITTKLVDSTEQLSPKLKNEVEAITFVLPEKRVGNERHDNAFWQSQRDRLAKLIEALSKNRPDFQCPLLITYYSDDISDVHDTLYNIPELLGFKDEKTITDYHVLLMRKESITTRICDEMFWLFGASVN